MERLTYRDKDGFPMMKKRGGFKQGGVERLAAYEDTGLTPEEVLPKDKADEIALKLMRLADLESHRLIDADALMDVIRQHEFRVNENSNANICTGQKLWRGFI